ncbi:acetyl-coenzyme A synthetase [Ruegeria lacuscaerulensis ITI-1157]|nr:acetyl-coenzyme A synthetase [Ruegeria lacuscaerulensis ITI-1157]
MYEESVSDPEAFWGEHGKRIDWIKPYTKVKDVNFDFGSVKINWYADGTLNVSANCLDRHLKTRGDQTAIIWEPDDPNEAAQHITYAELHRRTCRMANILESLGVRKGDRVVIYLPMIPEAAYAMLACARIGAIHSIVFAGFSPDALAARINGCDAKVVITADEAPRGGRKTPLKSNADAALLHCKDTVKCLVVKRTGGQTTWIDGRDFDYNEMALEADDYCAPAEMNAEDPLFILYTSGSTGQPKGVVHTTGGYLVYASMTHEITFDYHDGDIYWCTADVGWVTGHSYIVYGPLANGATTLMFEGVPTYPDASRFWQVCEKHKVNQFYTAPHRDPRVDGSGQRVCRKMRPVVPAHPGHRGRAHQPRGLDVVLRGCRQGEMPDRRHLVADRDRWPHDDPPARRACDQARLGDEAFLWCSARRSGPAVGRRNHRQRG